MEGCKNCTDADFDSTRYQNHVCRVCELEDGDTSLKLCYWCNTCQVFICVNCKDNLLRRAKAVAGEFIQATVNVASQVKDAVASAFTKGKKKTKDFLTDEFSKEDEIKPTNEA